MKRLSLSVLIGLLLTLSPLQTAAGQGVTTLTVEPGTYYADLSDFSHELLGTFSSAAGNAWLAPERAWAQLVVAADGQVESGNVLWVYSGPAPQIRCAVTRMTFESTTPRVV